MARTVINTGVGINGSAVDVTAKAISAGATGLSGYYIDGSTFDEKLGILVINNGSATGTVELKASDYYENAGKGDASYVVGANSAVVIGPIEGTRFRQADGTINIDSVGVTGMIYAVEV